MAAGISDREEKIKNAICFFAFEHERLTSGPLTHASLYKYLAFLDYASIEETGAPALGLLYRRRGTPAYRYPCKAEQVEEGLLRLSSSG